VGFAGSSRATAPLSIVDQARHAREVLAELGIGRAHVVGHSSGACIALQLALDAPAVVQSLALLEPVVASGPVADQFVRTEVAPAFACYAAGDGAGAVDLFMRAVGGPDYRTLIERTLGASALQQVQADADMFFQIEGPSVMAWQFSAVEAARVERPVLLLVGGDSRPVYQEGHQWLLERLPLVEGLVVPGANHLLPLQQPARLAEALGGFFARYPLGSLKQTEQ
jgi:3-oxoadipate enol-lactonase